MPLQRARADWPVRCLRVRQGYMTKPATVGRDRSPGNGCQSVKYNPNPNLYRFRVAGCAGLLGAGFSLAGRHD